MFLKLTLKTISLWSNIVSCLCSTVVGIRGKDGVVFGVERLVQSKLYEDDANKRIFHIDLHIGMVT